MELRKLHHAKNKENKRICQPRPKELKQNMEGAHAKTGYQLGGPKGRSFSEGTSTGMQNRTIWIAVYFPAGRYYTTNLV